MTDQEKLHVKKPEISAPGMTVHENPKPAEEKPEEGKEKPQQETAGDDEGKT